jgi:beta-galactosidase
MSGPVPQRRARSVVWAAWCAATLCGALVAPATGRAEPFPDGFFWGTAIAGFQTEAGKGRNADPMSDWYVWTHDPGNIADRTVSGDLPEDGPGHWARFRSDLDLVADQLHNNAFRFSIEWSRIFPRSTEGIEVGNRIDEGDLQRLDRLANGQAVHHYRKVLDAAAKRGITPFVTLHHWTLPTWLHDPIATRAALAGRGPNDPLPPLDAGGWLEAESVEEFEKYAAYVAWELGDRADYWNTLNEPLVQVTFGFVNVPGLIGAFWPPGVFSFTGAIAALVNLEQANTVAYDALKRLDRGDADGDGSDSLVGPVMNMIAFTPANRSSQADLEATEHADYLFNRLFLNGVVDGDVDANGDGQISGGEGGLHGRRADFVGLNYYFRGRVTATGTPLTAAIPILDFIPATAYASPADPSLPPCPTTCSELGAEIYPQGFRDVIGTAAAYGLPVYITENGIADADDDQRPAYLASHLRQLLLAISDDGADVRGYFHWSLVDNLEWVFGYQPKFGLYSFDAKTLKRTPRPSAGLYAEIAARNALPEKTASYRAPVRGMEPARAAEARPIETSSEMP